MRHGGGGGGHEEKDGFPHVGITISSILALGVVGLVVSTWKQPKMAVRAFVAAILLLPVYVISGSYSIFQHLWFVGLLVLAGGWVASAETSKHPAPVKYDKTTPVPDSTCVIPPGAEHRDNTAGVPRPPRHHLEVYLRPDGQYVSVWSPDSERYT